MTQCGDTPYEELKLLEGVVAGQPLRQVIVNFRGEAGEETFELDHLDDTSLAPRFIRLSKLILANEMGLWSEQGGAVGSLRFTGDLAPWLDAESRVDNWDFQRTPDADDLEILEWDPRDLPEHLVISDTPTL